MRARKFETVFYYQYSIEPLRLDTYVFLTSPDEPPRNAQMSVYIAYPHEPRKKVTPQVTRKQR